MESKSYKDLIIDRLLNNIDDIADALSDKIVDNFVESIKEEGASEQLDDPAHPLHYIEEFKEFLVEEISNIDKHEPTDFGISIHTGDGPRLGFDEMLESDDTDAIKIIGTVIQGIVGNFVLVLPEQARVMFKDRFQEDRMGRFGGAFIMPVDEYEFGMQNYGWPEANIWEFSNFPGIPDLFDNAELEKLLEKKISEVLAK